MADSNNEILSAAFPDSGQNSGLQVCPVDQPVFNMSAIMSAAQNYKKLSSTLNQILGLEVRWFRAVPQQRSRDVIFQTYTLSNVEETPLCLKVIMGAAGFPDSKYNYDIGGLEYEIPVEVYIDKGYWESIAGPGTAPQEKDIVYFAAPNKLFEVASSYLWRGFAEQETTWKMNLKKHVPEASRRIPAALSETINNYTVSEATIFGDAIQADVDKIVNDKQFNQFNSTEKDKYKVIDSSMNGMPYVLDMYGIITAHSLYDLSKSGNYNAVTYTAGDNIRTIENRCITAWGMVNPQNEQSYEIESITELPYSLTSANYQIKLKSRLKYSNPGDTLVISRPGSLNFYATLIDNSTNAPYFDVHIDDTVVNHLAGIKTSWTTAKGYKMKFQEPLSIIDGINGETHGFRVDVFANQYIKIKYGTQEHIAIMDQKILDNEWYGYIVNIGNFWNQYNVYVYEKHPSDETAKLQIRFYDTMDFTPEETVIDYYSINKSPGYITNIRLYNVTIEEEKQVKELLSYFVSDGDQIIIADTADQKFTAPYIGKQR
jgi:hypothetical protein